MTETAKTESRDDAQRPLVEQLVMLLKARPGLTCTQIGETLWPTGKANRQSYARPAGKLAKRAKEDGLIREDRRNYTVYVRGERRSYVERVFYAI